MASAQKPPTSKANRLTPVAASASLRIIPAIQVERSEHAVSESRITVQPGDSLWKLARRYRISVETLRQANGLQGDTLSAGKPLVIPVLEQVAP